MHQPVSAYSKMNGGAVPRKSISKWELVLIGTWIASFTVGIDILFELKLYDIIGLITIWHFRSAVFSGFSEKSLIGFAFRWLTIMFLVGFLIAIVRVGEPFFIAIAVLRLLRLLSYFSIFLIIRALPLNLQNLRMLIWIITSACLAQAVIILFQEQGFIPIFWSEKEIAVYGRLYSTGTLGLNHLNQVLFMTVGICSLLSIVSTGQVRKLWRIAIVAFSCPIMIFAILVGEARSGLVAIAVLGVVLAVQFQRLMILLLIVPLSLGIDASLGLDIRSRISNMWEQKVERRVIPGLTGADAIEALDEPRPRIWGRSLARLGEDPTLWLVGTGFQNYSGIEARGAAAGHNLYLHVLVELGITGLVFFLLFLRVLFIQVKRMHSDSKETTRIKIFCLASLITLLVLGMFNETLYPQRAIMGFMGFALAYIAVVGNRGWSFISQKNIASWYPQTAINH